MPTLTIRTLLELDGVPQTAFTGSKTVTGQALLLDETIPASTTDRNLNFLIDEDNLQAIAFLAIGGNLTLETDNASSPQDTIALIAGVPRVWDGTGTKPISDDTTNLFVTNANTSSVRLLVFAITTSVV